MVVAGNGSTVKMLENNTHLILGEKEIEQDFSLWATFTKPNVIWIILYQIFHGCLIKYLDTHAFGQLSMVTLELKLCIHTLKAKWPGLKKFSKS